MKKGARLINCARGGIYDEAALVEGLKSGHLGGVALDVYGEEPCTTSPLFKMPNVLCTPHLGASTEEAQTNVAVEAAELLIDFFTTGAIKQSVNMSPLDPKTLEGLRGYLNVAYRLGLLLAQGGLALADACRMSYKGEVAKKDTRLLSQAFAAGFLAHAVQGVNIVNAEVLLRERGIEVVEQRSTDIGDFSSLITAEVVSEEQTASAAGTLFGNAMPRLVQKNGCRLESFHGRHDDDLHPSRHARRDRQRGHDFRPAQGEHRPDGRGPQDGAARRRCRGRAGAGHGPARRGPRRSACLAADHAGMDGQAAAGGRVAELAGRLTLNSLLFRQRAATIAESIACDYNTCCRLKTNLCKKQGPQWT